MNQNNTTPKNVLITGATGTIGSALVPLFLGEKETRVSLLLRADNDRHLCARLEELFSFWGVAAQDQATRSRVTAFGGDVCGARLGLCEADAQRLYKEVTHIIHSAGNVRLNLSMAEARKHAVDSAHNVLGFARACAKAGKMPKLDVVSTVGVAGRMPGLIPEAPLSQVRAFHNTYEAAKAEAETILLDEIKRGLPITIHRPSMVVGDSQTGRIVHFQVFYYLSEILSGRKTRGFIPALKGRQLDIIPADYVAKAIWISANREDSAGRIFHLCSGPGNELGLEEHAIRMKELLAKTGPRVKPFSVSAILALLPVLKLFSSARNRRALATIPAFLAYLREEQHYDNRESMEFFERAGLRVPAVRDYLPTVLGYYLRVKTEVRK